MSRTDRAEHGRRVVEGWSIRWDDDRATDAYRRGLWTTTTLADALRSAAAASPDRVVLVDGGVEVTCRALLDRAASLAYRLRATMPSGSVVSFMLPNWYEAAEIYLAASLSGMVVNPVLPSLRDRELRFVLGDAGSRILFVPSTFRGFEYADMAARVTADLDDPPEVVVVRSDGERGRHRAYEEMFGDRATALPAPHPDSVRMVLYTSGTTGRPKGVLHTHNSINALIRQIGVEWDVRDGDAFLVPSSIAHIGGSIYAFEMPLLLGTTAVLMDTWNPDRAVELMVDRECTHMAGATPFLEQILAAAERAETSLPSLRTFVCGGASVPPSLIRRAAAYFDGAAVSRVYGSTEVPVTTVGSMHPDDRDNAADTEGRPGIAEITVSDPDATGAGEICVGGPQMLVGYLHAEDEADAFDDVGRFRTGDLGRLTSDDHLVVTGRAKDLIIRNGENISPKEVEDVLIDHPHVREIAVVGVPDRRTGERACAVVVPRGQAVPTVADLRHFLVDRGFATFKAPEDVLVWSELPKNDAGKVLKHRIRAELQQTESKGTEAS